MESLSCNIASVCPLAFSSTGGELFLRAVTSVIAAHCAVIGKDEWPEDRSEDVIQKATGGEKYDFIVIGAGTAGSLVASELSNLYPSYSILLLEAGDNPGINSEVPAFLFLNQNLENDWNYKVKPDGNSCLGIKNGSCIWSKGKGMGGSSSINAMIYIRGHPKDFVSWGKGWEYKNLIPYFEKQEKYFNISENYEVVNNEWYQIIRNAWTELDYTHYDYNHEALIGTKLAKLLIRDGKRVNTAKEYLRRANKNLHIMKNTYVEKILIDSAKKAYGIKIRNINGVVFNIMATKEVILSAGSIATPQILMLSGIGPKTHLAEKDISHILDLPVGQNLQDHLIVPLFLKTSKDTQAPSKTIILSILQYMLSRSGALSNIGITDFVGFINTLNSSDQPDIQFHHMNYPKVDRISLKRYLEGVGYNDDIVKNIENLNNEHNLLGIYPTLLHPKSKGSITLSDKKGKSQPEITTNYLNHPDDVEALINAIKYVRKLEKTDTFKNLGLEIVDIKLKGCTTYNYDTEPYWHCYISHMGMTIFHPVGTAKMGADETSVVDHDLLVRSTKNLRVVDASIMPTMPGANVLAATLAIAQKAVDIIKMKYLLKEDL
ncbi:glucose dehydrogenase [FAD, quinone]-like [Battus philenor]|uniref:glucose dehydrogenase [FAD, quinone]-like n=1 Tax=Battus philenor TaxID=42288 RepID=UPI0035CFBC59